MAYTINKFNGEQLIVLEDGTIDTSTSLGLVGRNYVGYGETQNENFVFLLENFSNDAPPSRPLQGQIWYNNTNNLVYVYDGAKWAIVGAAVLSDTAPLEPTAGALWLRTPVNTLNVWTGTAWAFIGPEAVPGFGITRARSTTVEDSNGDDRPVIFLEINGLPIALCSSVAFTVNPSTPLDYFNNQILVGINMAVNAKLNGSVTGSAGSADRLTTGRFINNVSFDGQANITIKASTTNRLTKGDFITGSNFDGSEPVTWSVDATSANIIGKVVVRNSEGGFAAGTITANVVGNLTGNVTSVGTSRFNVVEANQFIGATLTGNAFSASQLETPRKINGVSFDATSDITITSAAGTLTGNTLNSTVTTSSLTSVGTLVNLNVASDGIRIGANNSLFLSSGTSVGGAINGLETLRLSVTGSSPVSSPQITLMSVGKTIEVLGTNPSLNLAAIIPGGSGSRGGTQIDLGADTWEFRNVYAQSFKGNADTATLATRATNLVGGGAGAVPYQTSNGITAMLGLGAAGAVLTAQAGGIAWAPVTRESLTKGTYLNLVNSTNPAISLSTFDGLTPATLSVDATTTNTASKIVARDASGNFAAGTVTANLTGNVTGNVTGNAGTATRLQTPRTINGVAFDGTQNIVVEASDPNSGAPVGAILYYPSATIPVGWMICDGASLSTTTFSLLFSKIGYTFGGSGNTFRLPDLRGEFIRSWDGSRGVDSGRGVGTFQKGTINVTDPNYGSFNTSSIIGRNNYPGGTSGPVDPQFNVEVGMDQVSTDLYPNIMLSYVSANTPLDLGTSGFSYGATRPRNVALVACIKVFGAIDDPDQITASSILAYINSIPNYQITSGASSAVGFTNQVGAFRDDSNYFDVFPPAPKTMSNLVAFIPSVNYIAFAGGVNGDDSMRCTYSYLGDRIRVYVQNTEQRDRPAANFMAIWR